MSANPPADIISYAPPEGYPPAEPVLPGGVSPIHLLLRRKWLALGVFGAVLAMVVPAIWLLYVPSYRATAVVRISPVIEPIVYKTERSGVLPFYQSYVNTEVSVIYSPTVIERVLDREEIRQTEWYRKASEEFQGSSMLMMERLQKDLMVSPRRGTELIDVSIMTSTPRDSKTIVDVVVAEYIKLKDELERQGDTQRAETLLTEQSALQREIDGLIKMRFRIAKGLGTDAPEELRSKLSTQLSEMQLRLQELQRNLELTDWKLTLATEVEQSPGAGPDRRYMNDQRWLDLMFDLERARVALAAMRRQMGEGNPKVMTAVEMLDLNERLLREREAHLDETWQLSPGDETDSLLPDGMPKRTLELLADQQRKEIDLLRRDIEKQKAEVARAGDIAQEIANYDEELRQKREVYEMVRTRREVLEMEGKAPARVRPAALATEPSKPSNDRRILLSIMAVMGAMAAGVAVAYLRGMADTRIYDPGEVRTIYQAPFLGLLPKLPASHLPRELGGDLPPTWHPEGVPVNPRLILMESMRMVRTTLLERVHHTGEQSILITSSLPNTGKSAVAVLLSQSLSVVGRRVLLVEADLRRPVLSRRLDIPDGPGLGALLAGQVTDEQVIRRPEHARFDLLPAGDLPEDFDPELLANGVFSGCMKRWKQGYDFILLDSPPLLRVADAQIMAGHMDGTLMVLRSSHDRRTEALEAFAQLGAVGGMLLGTVLIGGQFSSSYEPDYYGYTARNGYSHRLASDKEASPAQAN